MNNLQQRYQFQIKQQLIYQPNFRPAPQKLNPQLVQMFNNHAMQQQQPARAIQQQQKQPFPLKKEAVKANRCGTWKLSIKQKFQTLGKKISSCYHQVIAVLKKTFTPTKKKMAAPIKSQEQLFQPPITKPVYVVRPLPPIPVPAQLPQYIPPKPINQPIPQSKPAQTPLVQPETCQNEVKQVLPTPPITLQKRFIRPLPSLPQPKPQIPLLSVQTNQNQNELESTLSQKQVEIPCENKLEGQVEQKIQIEEKAEEIKHTEEVSLATQQSNSHEVEKEVEEKSPLPLAPPLPPRIPAPASTQKQETGVKPASQLDRKDFLNETDEFNKKNLKKQIPVSENTPTGEKPNQGEDLLDLIKKKLIMNREALEEDDDDNDDDDEVGQTPSVLATSTTTIFQSQEPSNHSSRTDRKSLLEAIEGFRKSQLKTPKNLTKDLSIKKAIVPLRDALIQQLLDNVVSLGRRD